MKIELITQETHEKLKGIFEQHPALTLQNNGYEYLNQSKFTEEETKAFSEVSDILRKKVYGFSKFHNFRLSKNGRIQLRFDYNWNYGENVSSFYGVGYILLDELLNGFEETERSH